ncbi:MAG: hypothetical protein Q8Q09_15430 [Deltaproteobacteria bacterium]|nr:hypothetical protein [Deltaproteobacteria bacterium]
MGSSGGASSVTTSVLLGRAVLVPPTVLDAAQAQGSVVHVPFCLPPTWPRRAGLTINTSALGPALWAVAVTDAPTERPVDVESSLMAIRARQRLASALETRPQSQGESLTISLAETGQSAIPIGGEETDFLSTQLRGVAREFVGARAIVQPMRASLSANESREIRVGLEQSRCYELLAVAVPAISDVIVTWADPTGGQQARETEHRPIEHLRFCPRYSGSYRASVQVFSGNGPVAMQVIEVRTP